MPYLPNLKACKSFDLQAFYFEIFCGVGENITILKNPMFFKALKRLLF